MIASGSSLQLALDVFEFCHVTCGEPDFAVGDYEQHVTWSELKANVAKCKLTARCEDL